MTKQIKEQIYYAKGMHCASCEVLIEKKILDIDGVKSVSSDAPSGEIVIEHEGKKPTADELNELFKKEGYSFSERPVDISGTVKTRWGVIILLPAILVLGFFLLEKFNVSKLVNISNSSSLPILFLFGLVAGVSSCAALVGGIILSMSKQWADMYSKKDTLIQKMEPHVAFNVGRLISYAFLGGVLGAIGKTIRLSQGFAPLVAIVVSVVMVLIGLQMLGIKQLAGFRIPLPKVVTRNIADERNFRGRYMSFVMGALTFFLPCGFTLTVQAMALLTGSVVQSSLMMLFFALGTTAPLLLIGFSAVNFREGNKFSENFNIAVAVVIIFFGFYNINSQMNVLNLPSMNDVTWNKTLSKSTTDIDKAFKNTGSKNGTSNTVGAGGLPQIVDGKQIVKTDASSSGYTPRNLKAKVGIPVRWEITDKGTSGCTNAIISKDLFEGQIPLTYGKTSVKEFTPTKVGTYKFSCWMGMVTGTFEIVQ